MTKALINTAFIAASAAVLSGCSISAMIKKAKDQQLKVVPSPLELKGDSVRFTISATLPKGLLRKNKIYTLKPVYKYKDQKVELQDFAFKAKDYPNGKKQEVSASKTFSFAYTDATMDRGELVVQGLASGLNGKGKKTPEITIAKGLITTARSYQVPTTPVQVASGYVTGEELVPTQISFFFDQGSSKLKPSETKSARGQFLDHFIAGKNATKTVAITGNHSPEGREAKNVTLSESRAKIIEKYYRARMARYDYKKQAAGIQFVSKSLIEDWRPVKDSILASKDLEQTEKDQLIQIIDAPEGNFTDKEAKIEALPFFGKVFNGLYPRLRFAQTEILTIKQKKSEAEIALLSKEAAQANTASADKLSDQELAYAASLTPDLNEREAIFRAAAKKNDMWESHNNLAAILLEKAAKENGEARKALVSQANTNLQIANNKKQNAVSTTNQAIALLMLDDRKAAYDQLNAAAGMQPAAEVSKVINSLKGPIEIRNGEYDKAIASLNNGQASAVNSYNLALAYLLKKDYPNATANINQAVSGAGVGAQGLYLQSVIAARKQDLSTLETSLKAAAQQDAAFKAKALGDMEFDLVKDKAQYTNSIR